MQPTYLAAVENTFIMFVADVALRCVNEDLLKFIVKDRHGFWVVICSAAMLAGDVIDKHTLMNNKCPAGRWRRRISMTPVK